MGMGRQVLKLSAERVVKTQRCTDTYSGLAVQQDVATQKDEP